MGFIKVDHNQARQGRFLPPEGIYECLIASAGLNTTNGGTEYLKIKLTIRGDVPQAFPGETIEWPVGGKKSEHSDPDGFPQPGTIQHISRVVKFERGQILHFRRLDKGQYRKPIRVDINTGAKTASDKTPRVAYVYETEYPTSRLKEQGLCRVPVSDEEFPFLIPTHNLIWRPPLVLEHPKRTARTKPVGLAAVRSRMDARPGKIRNFRASAARPANAQSKQSGELVQLSRGGCLPAGRSVRRLHVSPINVVVSSGSDAMRR